MRSVAGRGMFVIFCGVLVTSSLAAAKETRPTLVVRTYAARTVTTATWTKAIGATTAVLNRAGIRLDWVHCSSFRAAEVERGPARCAVPTGRNDVVLRIISAPSSAPRDLVPLGDSMVDTSQQSGMLATIYLDRVEWLAHEAAVPVDAVLARAIAHELGHLLLGTAAHSARGLMRPVWRPEEFSLNRPSDWTIAPADSEQMRLAYHRRLEASALIVN